MKLTETTNLPSMSLHFCHITNKVKKAYAKKETKSIGSNDDFSPGDQVTHAKFGHGTVIESDSKTVTIMFDEAGQKKLAKGIAPIKKV